MVPQIDPFLPLKKGTIQTAFGVQRGNHSVTQIGEEGTARLTEDFRRHGVQGDSDRNNLTGGFVEGTETFGCWDTGPQSDEEELADLIILSSLVGSRWQGN